MGSASERHPYHHGDLRNGLVQASLEILEREGIGGLGLRAAARAAGVSQTAPYHHFGGKEGLLAAVAAHGFRLMLAVQSEIEDESIALGRSAEDAISELGIGYVTMARRNPELFKLMFGPTIPNRADFPELVEAYEGAYGSIEDATRRLLVERRGAAEPGEVALEVASSWATVHGLAILLIDERIRPGEGAMPAEDELVRGVLHRFAVRVGQTEDAGRV